MTRRHHNPAGFTLIEVMIALAILGAGLVILLTNVAASVAKTQRAETVAIAAELARGKMYDLEEKLLDEGFQELNQEEEGDFSDEGRPGIKWKAEIVKIELPGVDALSAGQGGGADGEGGEAGGAAGGMLGGMLGGGGEGEGEGSAAGAGMLGTFYEPIRNIAEQSVRKVTLTVTWHVAADDETLVFDCYFTDPSAVTRAFPIGGGGGGATGGTTGGGTAGGTTGGKTTGGGTTGGSSRGKR